MERSTGSTAAIAVDVPARDAPPVGAARGGARDFRVALPVFEGPLQLLLHLIESRQLDILTVPLASLADAYVEHLATQPVDPATLGDFVSIAAQLIELKSRRLLPTETIGAPAAAEDEPDEEELRRRLIEYRALRDAARMLGERDGERPAFRREPRDTDLPQVPAPPLSPALLVAALERLARVAEPEPPPPELMAREVTIGQQIELLLGAVSETGTVILQAILAACASRMEATVTFMAALELVRRREVRAEQTTLFGPILLETVDAS
ncbi:MAG TPA: segregation/condensation protein A [Candidatus Limnocylindria bacterium]|nr:segregation/condensation protein A [Candidatus Limnocylindria bacterium]